jgi:hypothetical protein
MGQLFVPVAGGVLKRDAYIFAGLGLFRCSSARCGTRGVSAGEGLGIGALDLIGPSTCMFHNPVNNSAQGNLLILPESRISNAFEAQGFQDLMPTSLCAVCYHIALHKTSYDEYWLA